MADDPFYIVKDEVQKSLNNLQQQFSRLANLKGPQASHVREEITSQLKTIEWDIQDLEETVRIVESNPAKFRLTTAEVTSRRSFVEQCKSTLDRMHKQIQQQQQQQSASTKQQQSNANFNNNGSFKQGAGGANTNNAVNSMIQNEGDQQQLFMQRQDEQLDSVLHTVVNIKNIANTMNTELDDQQILLDRLDEKVDSSGNRLRAAQKRLDQLLKANGTDMKTFMCIVVLVIIVIILFFVVLL
ncbi:hypothetical protein MP228_000763 [Amoeboaphelidium protococcarum]|nr:hypothetical protein MP228_000763 [Amoeboaphelidium protococcarum]